MADKCLVGKIILRSRLHYWLTAIRGLYLKLTLKHVEHGGGRLGYEIVYGDWLTRIQPEKLQVVRIVVKLQLHQQAV